MSREPILSWKDHKLKRDTEYMEESLHRNKGNWEAMALECGISVDGVRKALIRCGLHSTTPRINQLTRQEVTT